MSRAFEVFRPARRTLPVVVSVPHAGRDYPEDFLSSTRVERDVLRRSEDFDADALFAAVPAAGAPLIVATKPRLYIDLNRAPDDLDAEMFEAPVELPIDRHSARAASGLGLLPRFAASGGEIYRARLSSTDAARRIAEVHAPFHRALENLIAETRRVFGFAILIDGHSMPSIAGSGEIDRGRRRADIVLGDRHGQSAAPDIGSTAKIALGRLGYDVARNDPFAGAYIAERHGHPAGGVHVLQVEVNRALYMDERRMERLDGFARVADDMARLVRSVGALDLSSGYRDAAE